MKKAPEHKKITVKFAKFNRRMVVRLARKHATDSTLCEGIVIKKRTKKS